MSEAQKLEDELLLAGLCGKFTDSFAAAMRKLLSADVSLSRTSRQRMSRGDFVKSAYCCFHIGQAADGAESHCMMAMSYSLASLILCHLLGAADDTRPDKPLTAVETRLLGRAADIAAQSLAAAIGNSGRFEASPAGFRGAGGDAETELLVAGFEVTIAGKTGQMLLALDGRAMSRPEGSYKSDRPASAAPLEISAALEGMTIPADEIASLARGDVITTEAAADGEIIVKVAGIPKFAARLGSSRGRRAITITRKL